MGVVVVLLVLLSGDVETNPGPVGKVLCVLQYDVSLASHTHPERKNLVILSSVSTFNHERAPMYVDSNSTPSNQLTANNYSIDDVEQSCQHLKLKT